MSRRHTLAGFTLLEMMIAVAILGVALTSLFISQGAATQTAARARNINIATLLARCKMGEIAEKLQREGLPAVEANGDDECCEHAELEGFTCNWVVRRIVLPDAPAEDEGAEGGTDPITRAVNAQSEGGADAPSQVQSFLQGGGTSGESAGSNPLAEIAMQYAYPMLKPSVEDQVRRVTVTVKWIEGTRERSYDVVSYLVSEQGQQVAGTQDAVTNALNNVGGTPPVTPPPAPPLPGAR